MFDPITAKLLRSASALPGLDSEAIPRLLTRHYAELVSARLRGVSTDELLSDSYEEWPLTRIADTYELITSIHSEPSVRKASAFVAATAQQILAKKDTNEPEGGLLWNINRDRVDPTISAALLFLAAAQYADANEAASMIKPNPQGQIDEVTILCEHIRALALGKLGNILKKRGERPQHADNETIDIQSQAFRLLIVTLIQGIEILVKEILSTPTSKLEENLERFEPAKQLFLKVLNLSSTALKEHSAKLKDNFIITYSGPRHLASLLLSVYDSISEAALTRIPAPPGADPEFWKKWICTRAAKFPFIWPNHLEAVNQGFHLSGKSAVMVLPTGAGKTTVSSLKIAEVLSRGKKVVFLAPTHALVEQLKIDLQAMFTEDLVGAAVSNDFDDLLISKEMQKIEVMTPESCLAMLSFAPETFVDVGLLVFDECHLLSPQSGKIRRALDAMLCLLTFSRLTPEADLLFLSAMLKNGKEFSEWIMQLTGRECVYVDLLWKPSRQARGIIVYQDQSVKQIEEQAQIEQNRLDETRGKKASGIGGSARNKLSIQPFALWGLQNNWLSENIAHCTSTAILTSQVPLSATKINGKIRLTPNVNEVASKIATAAAKSDLQTIVFVNTKDAAISVANKVSANFERRVESNDADKARWLALKSELGSLDHSFLEDHSIAVPHNANMLWLERDLAERMFRRKDGAKVIVATPTLAQGLNLPAQLAIIAGDKRHSTEGRDKRENLEAHEILNAAARAGRAGHLANGLVLLIPEPILTLSSNQNLDSNARKKLQSILPEDDRCVEITDPLQNILDRIMHGHLEDRDVQYTINRLQTLPSVDSSIDGFFVNMNRSLAAFTAIQKSKDEEFRLQIMALKNGIETVTSMEVDVTIALLASQSGLPNGILTRLKKKIEEQIGELPTNIESWIIWTIYWLNDDESATNYLLYDVLGSIKKALGLSGKDELPAGTLLRLLPGISSWISGVPIFEIEKKLGGDPSSKKGKKCPRARALVNSVIPRGLFYTMSLISHVIKEVKLFDIQTDLSIEVIEYLGACVKRGYDTPNKLKFASQKMNLLSRVQVHEEYRKANHSTLDF